MLIKETNNPNFFWGKIRSPRWRKQIRFISFGATVIALSFLCGIFFQRSDGPGNIVRAIRNIRSNTLINYIKGLTAAPERITIDIKHKDFQKLAYKRKTALEQKILVTEIDDYVPVKITNNGKELEAKVRLKGDMATLLEGKKWPLRVVIKGDGTLFGMKVFSLHKPSARNYFHEWFWHTAMKREGIIALRYDFVDVTINGKDLGIYGMEEHFEKRLIENNRRREGPIICFSEDGDIRTVRHFADSAIGDTKGIPDYKRISFYSEEIDLYRPTKTLADPILRKQFLLAKNLLELFRKGELKASEVFDVDLLTRYLALLDLFNARHAAKYGGFKMYYNPVTSRLEPICFDAEFVGKRFFDKQGIEIQEPIYAENWYDEEYMLELPFFKDDSIFELYIQELARISDKAYLDALFKDIGEELKKKQAICYSEYPQLTFDKNVFYDRQSYIRKHLDLPVVITAYFIGYKEAEGQKIIELDIGNTRPVPVHIMGLSMSDGKIFPTREAKKVVSLSLPGKPINVERVEFLLPEDFIWNGEYISGLSVRYNLLGLKTPRSETVIPWPELDEDFMDKDIMRQAPNVKEFDFLYVDDSNKRIEIRPGNWRLDKDLIVPRGYVLNCPEATSIDLSNSAKILSFSPLRFIGSEEGPILITSKDSTGEGVAVIGAEGMTILRYVVFDNLSNPSRSGWALTGSTTFYESPVKIENCRFSNNRSEDCLNIVRSDFSIAKSLFFKTSFDALDCDFTTGRITDSSFKDCGNDAIDISGTQLNCEGIFIDGAGDKGLSMGENSILRADRVEVRRAKMAVASKDRSETFIEGIKISDSKFGFGVYEKKTEFGPAAMMVKGLDMENIDVPYLLDTGSRLEVEGKSLKPGLHEEIIDEYLGR